MSGDKKFERKPGFNLERLRTGIHDVKKAFKTPLKAFFNMPPHVQKIIAFGGAALFFILLSYFFYKGRETSVKQSRQQLNVSSGKFQPLFNEKSIKADYIFRLKQELEKTRKQLKALQEAVSRERQKNRELASKLMYSGSRENTKLPAAFSGRQSERGSNLISEAGASNTAAASNTAVKTEEFSSSGGVYSVPPEVYSSKNYSGEKKGTGMHAVLIGDIAGQDNPSEGNGSSGRKLNQTQPQQKNKSKEKVVYLPPSFVQADLLTGFDAFVGLQGQSNPTRLLLRLRDLAVLPNDVKANLKGCFVIAEAYASLADEKAHVRLLRLTCLSKDGRAVIDEPVEGWVVDANGEIGLRGHVYAEMNKYLWRFFIAGSASGISQMYATAASNGTIGGLNALWSAPSLMQLLRVGLASGVAETSKELADFYMALAKQALPVIEVLPGKRVTVIFSKGVELHIRTYNSTYGEKSWSWRSINEYLGGNQ